MPSSINLSRFNRGTERLFNTKGGPAVFDIANTVGLEISQPIGLEDRILFGIESFGAAGLQVAVAANKSAAMIRNPLGSGVVVVLEKIYLASSTTMQINLLVAGSNPADLASAVTNHARADARGRAFSGIACSQDAPAADPGTGFLLVGVTFSGSIDFIQTAGQEIVLVPQTALRVVGQTVNQNLVWTFLWRERALDLSEST